MVKSQNISLEQMPYSILALFAILRDLKKKLPSFIHPVFNWD